MSKNKLLRQVKPGSIQHIYYIRYIHIIQHLPLFIANGELRIANGGANHRAIQIKTLSQDTCLITQLWCMDATSFAILSLHSPVPCAFIRKLICSETQYRRWVVRNRVKKTKNKKERRRKVDIFLFQCRSWCFCRGFANKKSSDGSRQLTLRLLFQ